MKKIVKILVAGLILMFAGTEAEAKGIDEIHLVESCGDFNNPNFVEVVYYDGGENAHVAMEGVYNDTPCAIAANVDSDGTLYIKEAIEGTDSYYCDYAH